MRAEQDRHLELIERFMNLLAEGGPGEARLLCATDGWYRLVEHGLTTEGRGEDALKALIAALVAHHDAGLTPIDSSTHWSPRWFTTVHTYELDHGERWAQTAVFEVRQGVIVGLALYRYELRPR